MSRAAQQHVYELECQDQLTPKEALVMRELARRARESDHLVHVTYEELAPRAEVKPRQLGRIIAGLVAKAVLTKEHRKKGYRGTYARYRFPQLPTTRRHPAVLTDLRAHMQHLREEAQQSRDDNRAQQGRMVELWLWHEALQTEARLLAEDQQV